MEHKTKEIHGRCHAGQSGQDASISLGAGRESVSMSIEDKAAAVECTAVQALVIGGGLE